VSDKTLVEPPPSWPTLVYDGDCGICRTWVEYWRGLVGAAIVFRPYQEAAPDFPAIPRDAFRDAIRFIDTDGTVASGAAATFQVLRRAPGRGLWWALYRWLPGFGVLSELGYRYAARHRGHLAIVTRLLWGRTLEAEQYDLVAWVFLRLLALIYIAAFVSLGVQITGLVGQSGILPLGRYLADAHAALGTTAYSMLPTIFWFGAGDRALQVACGAGALLGAAVLADRRGGAVTRIALPGMYALYLSLFYAGQDFTGFQWDLLLLEAGFVTIFLPYGSRIVPWLLRCLAFRYVLMAGAAKLLSGDATWRDGTALRYHFWTQPLPTPLAWPASRLPAAILAAGTTAALVVELVLVFLIFLPRRLRQFAAASIAAFQSLIILTGNYNFFNLLTIVLCVPLLDDAALKKALPRALASWVASRARRPGRLATGCAALLAVVLVTLGGERVWEASDHTDLPIAADLDRLTAPFLIVNAYGLFANMTTSRPEVVIEGSNDGVTWREYTFRYQPGPLDRAPGWNIPHQPRLDWQMWFAALGSARDNPWFIGLMRRLLEGSASVVSLFGDDPFAGRPPKYVRAQIYEYRFADPSAPDHRGQWWSRIRVGLYFPRVSLEDLPAAGD
jgi:predicted DCC family thiol-disulfide oxidoreductase YuxK